MAYISVTQRINPSQWSMSPTQNNLYSPRSPPLSSAGQPIRRPKRRCHPDRSVGSHRKTHSSSHFLSAFCADTSFSASFFLLAVYFFFSASSASSVRGQSAFSSRDKLLSASTLPPVWHFAQ